MGKTLNMIIFLLLSASFVFASSGYFEPCAKNPRSLYYCSSTNKIYHGCAGGENYRQLIITNPLSLNEEKIYHIDGLTEGLVPINNGNSILVLIAEIDHQLGEDGVLRQIAYSDGHTENEFAFLTSPLGLVVDGQENFAYVTCGLAHQIIDPTITKIDLSTWQRVGEDEKYGRFSYSLALTHDDSKLYVKNESTIRREKIGNYFKSFYEIGVFNTSNMAKLTPVEIEVCPAVLKMGYDDRLYVSSWSLHEMETPLLVIDTTTDTVTPLHFDNVSFWEMSLDPENCKLYCAAYSKTIHPSGGLPYYMPSNMVYQIDLDGGSYSFQVFTPAEENIALIEAVPIDDPNYSCRLFATANKGKKVYYMDIQ